jgi:hypothetical protein
VRCYLPSTGTVLVIIVIGAVLLRGPAGHVAAGVGTIAAILAVTALVAGVFTGTILAARTIQRRRAAAGGCVGCRFQCQRAMAAPAARTATTCRPATQTTRRPLLVGVYNREPEPARWPHAAALDVQAEPAEPAGSARSGDGGVARAAQDQQRARSNGDLIPT